MAKSYPLACALATVVRIAQLLTFRLRIEIASNLFHHLTQIMAQFIQCRSTDKPISTINIVNGQVGHQRKSIGNGRNAAALGRLCHIKLLNNFTILIAEKRKPGAEPGSERVVNLGWIHADDGELTIVHRQFFLEFYVVAQLHLAFGSPVATVEGNDQREFPRNLRKFHPLPVLVLQFDIGKPLADDLIHDCRACIRLWGSDPQYLRIPLSHLREVPFLVQLLQ